MRCKPGDLAVRVRNSNDSKNIVVGAIVRCIEFLGESSAFRSGQKFGDVWAVDFKGRTFGPKGYRLGVPDRDLQPIRDTGDDARDETLDWVPVPSREKKATT